MKDRLFINPIAFPDSDIGRMDFSDAAILGLFMPVLSLVDSAVTWALIQVFTILGDYQLLNGQRLGTVSTFEVILTSLLVMLFLMGIFGYFNELTDGIEYPKRSIVYVAGSLLGLALFSSIISTVTLGGIGSDAITSSVISIVITSSAAGASLFFRGSAKFNGLE